MAVIFPQTPDNIAPARPVPPPYDRLPEIEGEVLSLLDTLRIVHQFLYYSPIGDSLTISMTDFNAASITVRHPGSDFYYPNEYTHQISQRAIDNSSLQLEDGSRWSIISGKETLARWRRHDPVQLEKYFMGYPGLRNLLTDEVVLVDLKLGPFRDHPHTKEIFEIDLDRKEISLRDGMGSITRFTVDYATTAQLQKWHVGDSVIPAFYKGVFSNCEMLINFALKQENELYVHQIG